MPKLLSSVVRRKSDPQRIRRHWRSLFRVVMDRYQEINSSAGTASCEGRWHRILQGRDAVGYRNRYDRPLSFRIEYLIDVELCAKNVLDSTEHKFFKRHYCNGDERALAELIEMVGETGAKQFVNSIQEKCGRLFRCRGISPVRGANGWEWPYFTPSRLERWQEK